MQKITVTFIYGKDDSRKLKYRLTGDIPVGVMLEKLIGFQFIVDSADPKTFNVLHKGIQLEDLSKTFDECEIIDGDEIYLIPTVFDPIPPLPENDTPIKKPSPKNHEREVVSSEDTHTSHRPSQNRQGARSSSSGGANHGRRSQGQHYGKKQGDSVKAERNQSSSQNTKPQTQNSPSGEKKEGPVPFKPHSRNYHRNHGRRPGNTPKSN